MLLFLYYFAFYFIISNIYCWDYSWSGYWFFSRTSWTLRYLAVFIYIFILTTEKSLSISRWLCFCYLLRRVFFSSHTYFLLFFSLELLRLPLLVLALVYGAQIHKIQASFYLIFFSVLTSIPGLFLYLGRREFDGEFPLERDQIFAPGRVFFLMLMFFIKIPVYFFHFWLPLLHVESPTSRSVFLASALLKVGVFGVLLFSTLLNWTSIFLYIFWFSFSVFFLCSSCVAATDTKAMAAYSSILHISLVFLMCVYRNYEAKLSTLLLVMGHGFVAACWFFFLGILYKLRGTRLIYISSGYFSFSFFFFLISVAISSNCGAPFGVSFLGELHGLSSLMLCTPSFFFAFFVYYLVSFYYSFLFIVRVEGSYNYRSFYYFLPSFILLLLIANANYFYLI